MASASIDIPNARGRLGSHTKHGAGLLTPPSSISPLMPAHAAHSLKSPPLLNIVEEDAEVDMISGQPATPPQDVGLRAPLSVGALSGLDARAVITPSLLARDYLPSMLANGPQPIRHLMGELTQTLPGFSRIAPAKARRLVVAALEGRGGGGRDADITFCKIGWGRWDAYKTGERDTTVPLVSQSLPVVQSAVHNWPHSGSMSDGYDDVNMDGVEQDADNMSLDGVDDAFSSSDVDESDATDDDDWAAVGPQALRKASLPAPGQPAPPRTNYQALGVPIVRASHGSWSRRFSSVSERSIHSGMVSISPQLQPSQFDGQTPEEKVAIEALLRMGSI